METAVQETTNTIQQLRTKLTELGVDPSGRIAIMEWVGEALIEYYRKGSDDAARIYKGAYQSPQE